MQRGTIEQDVCHYYTARLREHGPVARGVDWNSVESQELRFAQLLRICEGAPRAGLSLLDFGCGYGALREYLRRVGLSYAYTGFDLSEEMIATAAARCDDAEHARFLDELPGDYAADFTIASGVFNVRLQHEDGAWNAYIERTLGELARRSRRGFAFNVLTRYSDADRRRADLYYADPLHWFDHCKRTYSRYVALLHDYPLYEFTLLVRATEEGMWQRS